MNIFEAVIIAIVEGLTEFLPVSSTGHMIIAEHLMKLGVTPEEKSFVTLFTISIQLGAILAVVVIYWRQFFQFRRWQFYAKLLIGVLPALLLGYLFSDKIDELLFNPTVVAIAMLAGGVVLLIIDKAFKNFHYWWHAAKTDKKPGRGILFLPGRAHHVRRDRLFLVHKRMA